jgi:DNA mismatch repair protein MutS2
MSDSTVDMASASARRTLDEHSLRVLEFDAVRALLCAHARTAFGRRAAEALAPSTDRARISSLLDDTTELRLLLDLGLAPPLAGTEDIADIVAELPERRAPLEPDQLLLVAGTLDTTGHLKAFLGTHEDVAPRAAAIADTMADFSACVGEIVRCIDSDKTIRDTASPRLEQLRRSLRALKQQIERKLRALMDSPELQGAIDHRTITTRGSRPVIAIKSGARRAVPGTLLDKSNTGATVYIEPHAVTELANEFEDTRFEESREVTRILWELTRRLADRGDDLTRTLDALALIDLTTAKARFSRQYDMTAPELAQDQTLCLADARHPLLLHYAAVDLNVEHTDRVPDAVFARVIPVRLRLGDDFDQLVVTGPNTGGKTVALKAVGLLALMVQSGLHVPAASGTVMPVYDAVCADIGDEQSLAQSLSTFSSHMRTIVQIVENADARTLVLLDELGAGTDPAEGAALATAILDHLRARHAHVLATTHLGALKSYAYTTARVENASMEFDTASLEPTFRLLLGQPGSSNALVIARRLGMPALVLDRTREFLASGVADTEELINKVQQTRTAAEQAREEAEQLKRELSARMDALDSDRQAIEDRAQRFVACTLDDARKLTDEFAAAAQNAPAPWSDKAGELKRRIEEILAGTPLADQHARFIKHVKEGDRVYVSSLQAYGVVRMLRRRRQLIRVAIEGVLYDVPYDQVAERPFALADPRTPRARTDREEARLRDEPQVDDTPLDATARSRFLQELQPGDQVYAPALRSAATVRHVSDDRRTVTLALGVLDVQLAADQLRPCRRGAPTPDQPPDTPQQ